MKRSQTDPEATQREFREDIALSYEANQKIAERIGITVVTPNRFLSAKRVPRTKTLPQIG